MSKFRKTSTKDNAQDVIEVKRAGFINEFLWMCAGVNRKVLRQCPTEYAKYAGIGGTILFTALMASLSGGYALNFVFDNVNISIAFGIFWGLMIFNLDRFIVNTMYSDGKHSISWDEFKSGLPRLIMAVFLGIIISTPLELKIFYKEINAQMQDDMKAQVDEFVRKDKGLLDSLRGVRDNLREAPLDVHYIGSLNSKDTEQTQKQKELDDLRKSEKETYKNISNLTNKISICYASHNYNDSIKAKKLVEQRMQLKNKLKTTQAQINELDVSLRIVNEDYKLIMEKAETQRANDIADIDIRIKNLDNKINTSETSYSDMLKNNFGGLRAQMKTFSELRKEDKSTDIAAWFIMLLFVIIETAPTFFKMMMQDGSYDNLLKAERHRVKVLSEKRISDINDEVNTSVMVSTEINKKRLAAEIKANEELMSEIASVQSELLKTAIEEWRKQELEKIKENPGAYISMEKK